MKYELIIENNTILLKDNETNINYYGTIYIGTSNKKYVKASSSFELAVITRYLFKNNVTL